MKQKFIENLVALRELASKSEDNILSYYTTKLVEGLKEEFKIQGLIVIDMYDITFEEYKSFIEDLVSGKYDELIPDKNVCREMYDIIKIHSTNYYNMMDKYDGKLNTYKYLCNSMDTLELLLHSVNLLPLDLLERLRLYNNQEHLVNRELTEKLIKTDDRLYNLHSVRICLQIIERIIREEGSYKAYSFFDYMYKTMSNVDREILKLTEDTEIVQTIKCNDTFSSHHILTNGKILSITDEIKYSDECKKLERNLFNLSDFTYDKELKSVIELFICEFKSSRGVDINDNSYYKDVTLDSIDTVIVDLIGDTYDTLINLKDKEGYYFYSIRILAYNYYINLVGAPYPSLGDSRYYNNFYLLKACTDKFEYYSDKLNKFIYYTDKFFHKEPNKMVVSLIDKLLDNKDDIHIIKLFDLSCKYLLESKDGDNKTTKFGAERPLKLLLQGYNEIIEQHKEKYNK